MVIYYGLSYSAFARFPEFWGKITDEIANYKNYNPQEITHKIKFPTKFDNLGVILMDKTFSKQYGEKYNLLIRAKS